MLLKDCVSVFRLLPSETEPYGMGVRRMDISSVMVFEKRAVGVDAREEGKCVVYCFPSRSRVSGGELTEIQPGDILVSGACRKSFNPVRDDTDGCRRIVSVEKRFCGSEQVHHIVITAV